MFFFMYCIFRKSFENNVHQKEIDFNEDNFDEYVYVNIRKEGRTLVRVDRTKGPLHIVGPPQL